MTVTSDNPDLGEVREELEAEYDGDPIAIGFNPKYVVELLTQISSDQVTVALGGELDPGLIRPLTDDDYLGVVMPMRVRTGHRAILRSSELWIVTASPHAGSTPAVAQRPVGAITSGVAPGHRGIGSSIYSFGRAGRPPPPHGQSTTRRDAVQDPEDMSAEVVSTSLTAVSAEVTATTHDDMMREAREYAALRSNIVVKTRAS